jgi:hypothetical protein
MTGILLQRSKDPALCMCCSRMAMGLGVYEGPNKPVVAWVCNDRTCTDCTGVLVTMKLKELTALEHRACEASAERVTETIVNEVMGAMWDAGVRDLSAASPEHVTSALANLKGPMVAQVEAALIAFGASVKQQLQNGECPF